MDAGAALRELLGGLLLAAGSIIALSCGLCTGYFGIVSIASFFDPRDRGTIAFTGPFLAIGIVATAVGVGIARGGVAMLRGPSRSSDGGSIDRGD